MKSIQQNEAGILKARAFPCSTQQTCLRNKNIWLDCETFAFGLKGVVPELQLRRDHILPFQPCSLRAFMLGCWIGKDLTIIRDRYKYQHGAGDGAKGHAVK